ncbi:MAG: hypothetical protein AMXMBFR53_37540 [Gemmatimonadota bacterium]
MDGSVERHEERDFQAPWFGAIMSAVLSGGLTWLSAALALRALEPGHAANLIFVPIAIGTALVSLGWLRRAFGHRTVLSFTEDGILDGTALGAPVFIPWSEITSVSVGDNGMLALEIRDPGYLRVPLHVRMISRMLRTDREHRHVIPVRGLDAPHGEVAEAARRWHESLLLSELAQEKRRLEAGGDGASREEPPGDP